MKGGGEWILPVGQVCWKGGHVLFVHLFVLDDGSVNPGFPDLFSLGVGVCVCSGGGGGMNPYFNVVSHSTLSLLPADMYRECDVCTRWGGVHPWL